MTGCFGIPNFIVFCAGAGVTVIAGTGFLIGLGQHIARKRRGA